MVPVAVNRRPRQVRRTGALAALALLLCVLGASPAAAHNTLRSTDPADGSTVPTVPAQVTLTFDQTALEIGTRVVVTGPDGTVVSDGPPQLVDTTVVQPLVASLPAGLYTVDWRVTSADGHPLSGALTFTAAGAAAPAPAPAADPAPADDAVAAPAPEATEEVAAAPADEPEPVAEATPEQAVAAGVPPTDDDGGVPVTTWVVLGAGAVAALLCGTAAVLLTRRRAAGDAPADTRSDEAPVEV